MLHEREEVKSMALRTDVELPQGLSRGQRIRWLMERAGVLHRPRAFAEEMTDEYPSVELRYQKLHRLMYDKDGAVLEAGLLFALAEKLDAPPGWIYFGDMRVYLQSPPQKEWSERPFVHLPAEARILDLQSLGA